MNIIAVINTILIGICLFFTFGLVFWMLLSVILSLLHITNKPLKWTAKTLDMLCCDVTFDSEGKCDNCKTCNKTERKT